VTDAERLHDIKQKRRCWAYLLAERDATHRGIGGANSAERAEFSLPYDGPYSFGDQIGRRRAARSRTSDRLRSGRSGL
jgi:hypothetical protein